MLNWWLWCGTCKSYQEMDGHKEKKDGMRLQTLFLLSWVTLTLTRGSVFQVFQQQKWRFKSHRWRPSVGSSGLELKTVAAITFHASFHPKMRKNYSSWQSEFIHATNTNHCLIIFGVFHVFSIVSLMLHICLFISPSALLGPCGSPRPFVWENGGKTR